MRLFCWRLSLNLNWNIEYLITPRWWTPLWTCRFTGSLAPPSERHCSRNWWHWREKCPEPRHKELGWVNQIIQIFTLIWRDKCFMSYAQSIQVQVIAPFFFLNTNVPSVWNWCKILFCRILGASIILDNHPILDTRISVCPFFHCPAQGTPPWILKQGGLEKYGQCLISFNSKTNKIALFSGK